MARVKTTVATRARRKRMIEHAEGYYGTKKSHYKKAKEQVMKSWTYAYRDRKVRKREFRKLWIQRINAAARQEGLSYSVFMAGLKKINVNLNRKMLSELAIHNNEVFKKLAQQVKNIQT